MKKTTKPKVQAVAVGFTQAQLDSLAELAAPLGPSKQLLIEQTYSESGGTHTYAQTPQEVHDGYCHHVAKNGKTTYAQAILPSAKPVGP